MQFLLKDHLEKLESFLVIAEKGSIRKASESLGVTQPALSRQINILEDVLEQSLVERTRQGVELTEAGKLLRDFSRSLLRDAEDIERKSESPRKNWSAMSSSERLKVSRFESGPDRRGLEAAVPPPSGRCLHG